MIDVQGSEYEVLLGGQEALDSLSADIISASISKYNDRAPELPAVISLMESMGMFPVDDSERHRHRAYSCNLIFS